MKTTSIVPPPAVSGGAPLDRLRVSGKILRPETSSPLAPVVFDSRRGAGLVFDSGSTWTAKRTHVMSMTTAAAAAGAWNQRSDSARHRRTLFRLSLERTTTSAVAVFDISNRSMWPSST